MDVYSALHVTSHIKYFSFEIIGNCLAKAPSAQEEKIEYFPSAFMKIKVF